MSEAFKFIFMPWTTVNTNRPWYIISIFVYAFIISGIIIVVFK